MTTGILRPPTPSPRLIERFVDVSEPLDGASARGGRALREEELVAAYRAGSVPESRRREPCACGFVIDSVDESRAIQYSIGLHNASKRHGQWRIAMGIE